MNADTKPAIKRDRVLPEAMLLFISAFRYIKNSLVVRGATVQRIVRS